MGADITITAIFDKQVEKGDLNNDGKVDLSDAVLTLQVLTRSELSSTILEKADVSENSKIDMAEAIYILQKICKLR